MDDALHGLSDAMADLGAGPPDTDFSVMGDSEVDICDMIEVRSCNSFPTIIFKMLPLHAR